MKICFPVKKDEGLASTVYSHFGSAPMFVVVDMKTNSIFAINNRDQHHMHGACNPVEALGGQDVDAVVVEGIGAGALSRLNQAGIRVFQADASRIRENIDMLMAGRLPEYTLQQCCAGHTKGGGCAH